MKRYRNATVAFIVSILLTSCSEHVDANNSMAKYLGLILFSYISYNILLKKFFKSKKIRKYKDAAVHYISWFAVMSSICLFMFGITKMNNKSSF